MELSTEQKVEKLERRVDRLETIEKQHDFTIRDSSVKIGLAEGLAETTYKEIRVLGLEMHGLRAEIKELRGSTDNHFERLEQKMDAQEERFHKKFEALETLLKKVLENQK